MSGFVDLEIEKSRFIFIMSGWINPIKNYIIIHKEKNLQQA
jgi:hypothetical protein